MIERINFLVHNNQYNSKRYFTARLIEAFERKGVECRLTDTAHGELRPQDFQEITDFQPDLLLTFSTIVPSMDGYFICDDLKIPHLSILVDPLVYYLKLTGSDYSMISCVDQDDCDWISQKGFMYQFFLPHAVEADLGKQPVQKDLDIVFCGSCYDFETLREGWASRYTETERNVLEGAAEELLMSETKGLVPSLFSALMTYGLSPAEIDFEKMCRDVDYYVRGRERLELLTSFQATPVDIFGEVQWDVIGRSKNWQKKLSKDHIRVHPAIPYEEALGVMARANVCLNSTPFFKNGSHERILIGGALRSLMVTNRNPFTEKHFEDSMVLYNWGEIGGLEDRIQALDRSAMTEKAYVKVMGAFTYDHQAETILEQVTPMLAEMQAAAAQRGRANQSESETPS